MRTVLTSLATLLVAAAPGRSQDATLWSNRVAGNVDGSWVLTIPTGSSDYLSVDMRRP